MRTRKIFSMGFVVLLLFASIPTPTGAQQRTPVVDARQAFAAVSRTTTGLYWATANSSLNHRSVLLRVIVTGAPTSCKLAIFTGPTAALATVLADDPKAIIDCTAAAANHVVRSLDSYWNVKLETLGGGTTPAVQVYATLTNGFSQGEFAPADFSHITAALASTTLTEVTAAPATGSIVLKGIIVEKSTGATGTYTVRYGTGTNCGTGTTTLFGPVTNPQIGVQLLGVRIPAANALCFVTDAATTGVRAMVNAENK